MKPLIFLIPFLFMGCATIPIECMDLKKVANEKYFKDIDINPVQFGYFVSFKAMRESHERYTALDDYANCLEGK